MEEIARQIAPTHAGHLAGIIRRRPIAGAERIGDLVEFPSGEEIAAGARAL